MGRMAVRMGAAFIALTGALCLAPRPTEAAVMTPEASQAFDRYAALVEADLNRPGPFLRLDTEPEAKRRVLAGELVVESRDELDHGGEVDPPHALIHDFQGWVYMPGATLDRLSKALLDYGRYPDFYRPDVLSARLIEDHGTDRRVFLRLYHKMIFTVVLNTEYAVHYDRLSPSKQRMSSISTRIAEVRHPERNYNDEEPPGRGLGFLWRLNSYWKFEQAPGGVIAECRAISLSRDVPYGLGWALRDVVERFPRDSMELTLEGTRRAAQAR